MNDILLVTSAAGAPGGKDLSGSPWGVKPDRLGIGRRPI